jgi:thiamine pyrophosphokinase
MRWCCIVVLFAPYFVCTCQPVLCSAALAAFQSQPPSFLCAAGNAVVDDQRIQLHPRCHRWLRRPYTIIMNSLCHNDAIWKETDEIPTIYHKSPLLELYESMRPDDSALEDAVNYDPEQQQQSRTALIILNAPIQSPMSPLFQQLWHSSSFRVCADGGANRLLNVCHPMSLGQNPTVVVTRMDDPSTAAAAAAAAVESNTTTSYIPDCITGDLDSLLPATRQYYLQHGVRIVPVPDQDTNDLDKAIVAVLEHFAVNDATAVASSIGEPLLPAATIRCVVYGAFGGRFDQEMASFQSLYKYNNNATTVSLQLFLYDDHTMAFLLPAGCINHIHLLSPTASRNATTTSSSTATTTSEHVSEGPTCGLIPLGGTVESVTTTGLQWNLHNQPTMFGGLVSTSNRMVTADATMTVVCSHPLVFTAQVHAGIATVWSDH